MSDKTAPAQGPVNRAILIPLMAALAMLGPLSTDTYLPSFPAMAATFGVGIDGIQLTLTAYLLAMAVATLFQGALSDSLGRKPMIMGGLALFLVGSVGAAFAPSLGFLVGCRVLQGLSAGTGMVVSRAMVRDLFSGAEAQRVMSYITVVFGLAPVVAPIAGGWLEVLLGWRSVFVFMASCGVLLLVASGLALRESLPLSERVPLKLRANLRDYAGAMSHPRFLLQALSLALSSSMLFLYVSSAPVFVMQILHLSETSFAWLFIPLISGIMGGSIISGALAHRWRAARIIKTGYGILIASVLANLLYTSLCRVEVPWAILPIMGGAFGMALASPAMTIATLDLFPSRRGLASSLQSAVLMGFFSLFAGVVAPRLFHSAFALATGAAAGVLLGAILWLVAGRVRMGSVS